MSESLGELKRVMEALVGGSMFPWLFSFCHTSKSCFYIAVENHIENLKLFLLENFVRKRNEFFKKKIDDV